jgi:hypothetical protein
MKNLAAIASLLALLFAACQPRDPKLLSDPLVQCMEQLKSRASDLAPENSTPEELLPLRMLLALGTEGAMNLPHEHNSGAAGGEEYDKVLNECQEIVRSLPLR